MDWFVFAVGVVIGIVSITSTFIMKRNLKFRYGPIKSLQEKTFTLTRNINDQLNRIQQLDNQKQGITDLVKTNRDELLYVQTELDNLKKRDIS